MPELQLLTSSHLAAVLSFERENRAYFADHISDRGDAFFDEFDDRFDALLAEQASGACAFRVLVDEDTTVLGRFNLYDLEDGSAEVGYRVAQRVTGRGVATAAVTELCVLARDRHGLTTLTAGTSALNVASQKVLTRAGFVALGPADPVTVGGHVGLRFERDLTDL